MIESAGIQESMVNIQENSIKKLTGINVNTKKLEELEKAAQDFESVFINQFMGALNATVERDEEGMFSGGKGEEMFKSLLNQEIAKNISSTPETSFGFAKQIYEQMKNLV
jgi:Rod binding domain-containing protein